MRSLLLTAILGVVFATVNADFSTSTEVPLPELTFNTQDLDFQIDRSKTVNLTLSFLPSVECFNITFTVGKDLCADLDPIEVCDDGTSPPQLEWQLMINSTNNGKTIFTAKVYPDNVVNDENAFLRLSIMINPGINTFGDVLGWIYTIAWDISFLPQIYRNWKRKSVVGLAFDFLVFNFIGFFSYMMFNVGNLWIPQIQDEFQERHPTSVMHVRLNDVIFPLYALLCTAIQIIQCFFYKRAPEQRVSIPCRIISGLMVTSEVIVLIIVASSDVLEWLDLLLWFSYIKICVTCVKYIPQLYVNYQMKSTEGWSIWQVILDCTGGTLSLVQMFMLATNYDDWVSVLTDPAKLGLGLLSIFFNIFFFIQHFFMYRGARIDKSNTDTKSVDSKDEESRKSSMSSKSSDFFKGVTNPDPEAHM